MEWTLSKATHLCVSITLLSLALVLAIAPRRRPSGVVLAVFLALVGANFAASFLYNVLGPGTLSMQMLGGFTLAWDPFFLAAFATFYPYTRRTAAGRAVLVSSAVVGLLAGSLVLIDPSSLRPPRASGLLAGDLPTVPQILVLNMAVAYIFAWLHSVATARDAPTPELRRRAQWLAVALGIAVVPRIGLLPADLEARYWLSDAGTFDGLYDRFGGADWNSLAENLLGVPLMVALVAVAWTRSGATPTAASMARSAVKVTAVVAGGFFVVNAALFLFLISVGHGLVYGLRWIPFAFVLAYALLRAETLPMQRRLRRYAPVFGATVAIVAAYTFTAAALALRAGAPQPTLVPALVAVGAAFPAGYGLHVMRDRLDRQFPLDPDSEHRLAVYRVELEAAWASGPPDQDARARLERSRRLHGVSRDEARALEHVAATQAATGTDLIAPGTELQAGLVVGARVGVGAQADVYAARRHDHHDEVIVKVYRRDALRNAAGRRRWLREAQALARVRHPCVVRLLSVTVVHGRAVLVIAPAPGRPLDQVLASGPLPATGVARLAKDLLAGLGAVHAAGLVHRDVKPANILLDQQGHAVLLDFGLVAHEQPSDLRRTSTGLDELGSVRGTVSYMSPEQAQGRALGPRSDQYSAALVLYAALTGHDAIDVRGRGRIAALEAAARGVVDLGVLPPPLRAVLTRALARDPEDRFADLGGFSRALAAAFRGVTVGTRASNGRP